MSYLGEKKAHSHIMQHWDVRAVCGNGKLMSHWEEKRGSVILGDETAQAALGGGTPHVTLEQLMSHREVVDPIARGPKGSIKPGEL